MKKNFKAFLNPLLFTIDVSKRSLVDEMASKGGGVVLIQFFWQIQNFWVADYAYGQKFSFLVVVGGMGEGGGGKKIFFLQKSLLLVGTLNIPWSGHLDIFLNKDFEDLTPPLSDAFFSQKSWNLYNFLGPTPRILKFYTVSPEICMKKLCFITLSVPFFVR